MSYPEVKLSLFPPYAITKKNWKIEHYKDILLSMNDNLTVSELKNRVLYCSQTQSLFYVSTGYFCFAEIYWNKPWRVIFFRPLNYV